MLKYFFKGLYNLGIVHPVSDCFNSLTFYTVGNLYEDYSIMYQFWFNSFYSDKIREKSILKKM